MTAVPLECPNCHCPLKAAGALATGVACPRCNTWVAIDSQCSGVCTTCHTSKGAEVGTGCASDIAVPVTIQPSGQSQPAATDGDGSSVENWAKWHWKRLFKRIFAVR